MNRIIRRYVIAATRERRAGQERGGKMTIKEYEISQKDPHRIEGAKRGKAAALEFLRAMRERELAGEHKRPNNVPPDLYELSNALFLLTKYLYGETLDEKMGKNSGVVVFVKRSDGKEVLWHNSCGEDEAVSRFLARRLIHIASKLDVYECARWVAEIEQADLPWPWRLMSRWIRRHRRKGLTK